MKTIIAGSRGCTDYKVLERALAELPWQPTTILSGGARGVDRLGERWAKENGVPIEVFLAEWGRYGKSAGYKRNAQMAQVGEALVALWDYESKGTKHMIDLAMKAGLTVLVWRIDV